MAHPNEVNAKCNDISIGFGPVNARYINRQTNDQLAGKAEHKHRHDEKTTDGRLQYDYVESNELPKNVRVFGHYIIAGRLWISVRSVNTAHEFDVHP